MSQNEGVKSAVPDRPASVNPLKMSQPLGAALAFLGTAGCMPIFHGSQGCTSFGLVLLGRHFKESIPLQTTAMTEVSSTLGGGDSVHEAILNILKKGVPELVAVMSTGLTETKGEDIVGDIALFRKRHPEWNELPVVSASTPDFKGGFEDGYAEAVVRILEELVPKGTTPKVPGLVNVLAGSHLTVADLDEIRRILTSFGLTPVILPDLSRSLDGTIPEKFEAKSMGGTTLSEIRSMGSAEFTLVIGESLRRAGEVLLSGNDVPLYVVKHLRGLLAVDDFLFLVSNLSRRPIPALFHRERSRLEDAMLDCHFHLGGKKVVVASEPDLTLDLCQFLSSMGMTVVAAILPQVSKVREWLSPFVSNVMIGDLSDLEEQAARHNADLLVTHAHGRQASERLEIPLLRTGFPIFDRLGVAHEVHVGYVGSMQSLFRIANVFLSLKRDLTPQTWYPEESGSTDDLTVVDDRIQPPIVPAFRVAEERGSK